MAKKEITMRKCLTALTVLAMALNLDAQVKTKPLPRLKISDNKRYFITVDGKPFFWLGDTGWLLFVKCNREDAIAYLDTRKQQGFNVVQVMVLHELKAAKNVYGDSALKNLNVAIPVITEGNSFDNPKEYDYWDHVDYIIDEAAKRGIYMAMVPVWGSNVKAGLVNREQAEQYAKFLATRYKDKTNIVWLNGGDLKGSDSLEVWNTIGTTLKKFDPRHLVTFHPRGRNSSSAWFHNEKWLDFNMFQSGHRTYAQDTSSNETLHYGEDNWKYANVDYNLKPTKPTMDGEPSYENIPYGLHDYSQPRWIDNDLRRYGYWNTLSGGAGFTYGENSVMQFHIPGDKDANYDVKKRWREALHASGAGQMQYLKKLVESGPYFDRVPDQSIVLNAGQRYNNIIASTGRYYALVYTYTGRTINIQMGKIDGGYVSAYWYNPRTGEKTYIGSYENKGTREFDPPGNETDGNDWVLILESAIAK
jgi:hypothetical protein